jgi:hypothetical protein
MNCWLMERVQVRRDGLKESFLDIRFQGNVSGISHAHAIPNGTHDLPSRSNEPTLPTPNMTVSNYGPPIRNIHRQNHHFP